MKTFILATPTVTDAATLVAQLGLCPHPEGGFYREVYRSRSFVSTGAGPRATLTSIYFLLAAGQHSRWHVVDADEVWSFYDGDPLELLTYDPAVGVLERVVLGPASSGGATAVHVVPAGVWQAARPLGAYALVGCTVAPAFDFAGFSFVGDLAGHLAAFDGPLASTRDLV